MRTNQQSRQLIVRTSTLVAVAVIVLLGCSQHVLGQWTNGTDISNTNSGNVGIGTTPAYKLDILSSSSILARFRSSAAAHNEVLFDAPAGYNTNLTLLQGGTRQWYLGNRAANNRFSIVESTGAAEVFAILQNGNIGIGSISPLSQLTVGNNSVAGGTQSAGVRVETTLFGNTYDRGLFVAPVQSGAAAGNSVLIYAYPRIAAGITQPTQYGLYIDQNQGSGLITNFYPGIFMGGNVGIGTSSPAYKLDVNGNLNVQGGTTFFRQSLGLAANEGAYVSIGATVNNEASLALGVYRAGAYTNRFLVNNFGQVVLQPNGDANVGIGINYPNYKLDVQGGQVNAAGGLCINGDCKTAWSQVGGSQWTTSGSNIYYNSGNIGIGTTTPLSTLQIGTQTPTATSSPATFSLGGTYSNSAGANFKLKLYDDGVTGNTYGIGVSSASMDFGVSPTGGYNWYSGGANKMTLTGAGSVGIGTTSPLTGLHVASANTTSFRSIASSDSSGNSGYFVALTGGNSGGTPVLPALYWSAGEDMRFGGNVTNVTDGTGFSEAMRITSGGNVGIGTTTPGYKLDVNGNLNASGTITGGNIIAKYQDVAEWVPATQALPAGTVAVLNPNQSNQVMASAQAYDTRVAGVISERPGIALGEAGKDKVLVATTGRVRVRVDATRVPIHIGDLLVASDKEGMAMKSQPISVGGIEIHRPGTLIGKALEPLEKGTGEILVLLSLQ